MSTKKLQLAVRAELLSGQEVLIADKVINVEIHGNDPFLGLTVWHHDRNGRIARSRTSSLSAGIKKGELEADIIRQSNSDVYVTRDDDPLRAASWLLYKHLNQLLPDGLRPGFKERLNADQHFVEQYHDRVVEPIHAAVMAMCQNPAYHQNFTEEDVLWAVGIWTLQGKLAPGAMTKALRLGHQMHDVLLVKDGEDRGAINRMLA